GLVPEIRRLAEEKMAITLAISLHAPNDEKRRKLMPIANRYSLKELMPACRDYFEATGRRLTFEYALVAGENDSEADAAELAALIRGMHAHVNLIPVNPVKERAWRRSPSAQVMKFQKKLEKYGINVTIRREMGADISGACGQLRKSYIDIDQENRE
ncbi:MAG: 23S rRNA (adenine(2503)-C(2))-methyltransferase RlmN, partial [Eubacterium sp.]|nr:23S rRNA (adenine(2503)-C(2))-methyltransferase RlmN [Eubacterium sp.]